MDTDRATKRNNLAELIWGKPEGEWESILAPRCGGDQELMQEVMAFTRRCQAEPSGVRMVVECITENSAVIPDPERIGRYRVIRRIGSGGMGVVYKARLEGDDLGGEAVAVKLIKGGLDTEGFVRRFRAERYVLGKLVHPNIARILDAGSTESGRPYFVMEYIGGAGGPDDEAPAVPLYEYASKHRLGLQERLKLFQQVCSVVHFAHQKSVVHRDLKPTNILVTSDGEPHLLDFGLAKLLTSTEGEPSFLKSDVAGLVQVGTAQYMSPEQARGEAVSEATDIYSLGVLLYYLVTDRLPYVITPDVDAVRVICEAQPIAPSALIGRRTELSLPEQRKLDGLVMRALEKTAGARYRDLSEWNQAIESFLKDEPLAVEVLTAGASSPGFLSRYKVAAGVSLLVLILVAGFSYLIWTKQPAKVERPVEHKKTEAAEVGGKLPNKAPSAKKTEKQEVAGTQNLPPAEVVKRKEEPKAAAEEKPLTNAQPQSGEPSKTEPSKEYVATIEDLVLQRWKKNVGREVEGILANDFPNIPAARKLVIMRETAEVLRPIHCLSARGSVLKRMQRYPTATMPAEFTEEKVNEAMRSLRDIAEKGNTFAAAVLSWILANGPADFKKDEKGAFEFARKAADGGNPYGHYLMGEFYMRGIGQRVNHSEGMRHLEIAAERDVADAQWSLAGVYSGENTFAKKDIVRASVLSGLSASNPGNVWLMWTDLLYETQAAKSKPIEIRMREIARQLDTTDAAPVRQTIERLCDEWIKKNRKEMELTRFGPYRDREGYWSGFFSAFLGSLRDQ